MFQDWVVQVEISQAYIDAHYVNGCEVSARFDALNPSEHGTSATTLCAQPVDFVPADQPIVEPTAVDATAWPVAFTSALPELPSVVSALQTQVTLLANQQMWSMNSNYTEITAAGWYTIGLLRSVAYGEVTVRSDHEIIRCSVGRVQDQGDLEKLKKVKAGGIAQSFLAIRILGISGAPYEDGFYALQIEVASGYISQAPTAEYSAMISDQAPHPQGTSTSTPSMVAVDWVPASSPILEPYGLDTTGAGWTAIDQLSL